MKCRQARIENEIRMHFRHIRREAPTVSLQDSLESSRDGSALTLQDVVPDGFHMEDTVDLADERVRLRSVLQQLPARERQILTLRYGLGGQEPLTQQDTADILHISRSYVSHRH